MAASFKHYAFAVTALAGIYSAQLTVSMTSAPDDVARTIAQVETKVDLSAENIIEQIDKNNEAITANIALAESQIKELDGLEKVSEIKDLRSRHEQLKKDAQDSYELFVKSVESFVAAQAADYDRSAIETGMAKLEESNLKLISAFSDRSKFSDALEEARDKEATAREERISSLQGMLCQQKESLADLKDELSSKLADLTELISTQDEYTSPLYSPDFSMPWAQMQMPMQLQQQQMFNPFSFLMAGGMNNFMNMQSMPSSIPGMGMSNGMTQNNFYGQTSFNGFNMGMPQLNQQSQQRGPSQIGQPQAQGSQQVAPTNLLVPSFGRGAAGGETINF